MSLNYVGFALADSMFDESVIDIKRHTLTVEQAKEFIATHAIESCLNPSHKATIDAIKARFGIELPIPATPPKVLLKDDRDCVLVLGVRGLPRLTDRHEYTDEEIAGAKFAFTLYEVVK